MPSLHELSCRRPELAASLAAFERSRWTLPLAPEQQRHARLLLMAAAERERLQGLDDWLHHLRRKKIGKEPYRSPRQRARDVWCTFHELGEALQLCDRLPPPYRVRVGCDWTRPTGRGFDLQVEDADGVVCANIEVTSRAAPVSRAEDLLSAIRHIVAKIPGARGGTCGGAVAMRWSTLADPLQVIGSLTAALNRGEGPWHDAASQLNAIDLFCSEPGHEGVFARLARGDNGWVAECGPFAVNSRLSATGVAPSPGDTAPQALPATA